jgi:hypothetical protein
LSVASGPLDVKIQNQGSTQPRMKEDGPLGDSSLTRSHSVRTQVKQEDDPEGGRKICQLGDE